MMMLQMLSAVVVCDGLRSSSRVPARMRRGALRASDTCQVGDLAQQFASFREHHAKGEWACAKETYDDAGVVVSNAVGVTSLMPSADGLSISHAIKIPAMEKVSSGCDRCADAVEWREIPVGSYSATSMGRIQCAGHGVVAGPSLLRSGGLSTEVALAARGRRVSALVQHSPVWEEAASAGPPSSLRLVRVVLSREVSSEVCPDLAFPERDGRDRAFWREAAARDAGDDDEDDEFAESLVLCVAGGIRVTVPLRIRASEKAQLRLEWRPSDDALPLRALAVVSALGGKGGAEPPRLVTFSASESEGP